jgi:hypothetical protein
MWVTMPTPAAVDSRADIAQVDMKVESSTSPGAVVAGDEASFLTVPPRYQVGDGRIFFLLYFFSAFSEVVRLV